MSSEFFGSRKAVGGSGGWSFLLLFLRPCSKYAFRVVPTHSLCLESFAIHFQRNMSFILMSQWLGLAMSFVIKSGQSEMQKTGNEFGVSFCFDENLSKLILLLGAKLYEYTKIHWSFRFKEVNVCHILQWKQYSEGCIIG